MKGTLGVFTAALGRERTLGLGCMRTGLFSMHMLLALCPASGTPLPVPLRWACDTVVALDSIEAYQ